nr:unnamed protein product [Naegleria fowleri]
MSNKKHDLAIITSTTTRITAVVDTSRKHSTENDEGGGSGGGGSDHRRPHNDNDENDRNSMSSGSEELITSDPPHDQNHSTMSMMDHKISSTQQDSTIQFLSCPSNLDNPSPPQDKYHLVTIIFFLQGMGELFPWNAMLSAVDYLLKLYHAQRIMLWMTSVYSLSTLISLFVLIKYGTHIRYLFRIYIPYFILTILLIIVPLLYVVINHREIEFYIILGLVVLMAICTGSIQSSIYGLSSKLPHHYMNTVVSGSAFAGLFITCLRILTKITIERGYDGDVPIRILSMSTIIYFACCACLNVVCLITFYFLTKTRVVKYYTNDMKNTGDMTTTTNDPGDFNNIITNNNNINNIHININSNNNNNNNSNIELNATTAPTTTIFTQKSHHEITSIKNIVTNIGKKIWIYALSVFLDFFVTLTVFPGLSSSVETIYVGTSMETWLPVWTNLTFQIYDFVGRIAYYWIDFFPIQHGNYSETMLDSKNTPTPTQISISNDFMNHLMDSSIDNPSQCKKFNLWNACQVEKMEIVLFLIIALRILFIPLFIFCLNPKIFNHDSIPLILVFLLSLSGGYLNSVLMSNAPKKFTNLHEKEITATMMTFFLLFGITVGSNTGLGIGLLVLK